MSNPLLTEQDFPPFNGFTVDDIEPALDARIDNVFAVIDQQLETLKQAGQVPTWDTLVAPLEEAQDLLNQVWSPVSHLNGVKNSQDLREAYSRCVEKLTDFATRLDQHQPLFLAYQALANSDDFNQLESAQQKVVNDALNDFKLAGVDLVDEKKAAYGEIQKRLSELSTQFSNNVLDATAGWYWHTKDESALAGLPDNAIATARSVAESKALEGFVITLDFPSYIAVMTYAEDRTLRETLYRAFVTRASHLATKTDGTASPEWNNAPLIDETLELRHRLAELLGFANYAELSLAKKMAESPVQVTDFLLTLAKRSRSYAEKELKELTEFAKANSDIDTLQSWDMVYFSEKLKQEQYAISQAELKPYFPADTVTEGLFKVTHKLFGVTIEPEENSDLWHKDAKFYRIIKDAKTIAYFYLDIFAREHKRGGAWMADARSRRLRGGELQLPIAFLTCNFSPPVDDKPSLLTFDEVTTLFHEFGHGLHHMLTQMSYAAISGISGVPWDAVELPSQFLENWCWQKEVIPLISGHHETGAPLPDAMLEKMLKAKHFQSGLQMLRQVEFSLFDMRLHSEYNHEQPQDAHAVLQQVRKQVSVVFPPDFSYFQNSFSHVFAGGYAAGYYSYKWAEVLSADAFSLFEENGIFDQATGQSFLNTILANGGSREPAVLFKEFRGREPSLDALMRHSGMDNNTVEKAS